METAKMKLLKLLLLIFFSESDFMALLLDSVV